MVIIIVLNPDLGSTRGKARSILIKKIVIIIVLKLSLNFFNSCFILGRLGYNSTRSFAKARSDQPFFYFLFKKTWTSLGPCLAKSCSVSTKYKIRQIIQSSSNHTKHNKTFIYPIMSNYVLSNPSILSSVSNTTNKF